MKAHGTPRRRHRQVVRPHRRQSRSAALPFPAGDRPVFRNRRVRLETEKRGKVIPYGGLALAHKLVHGLGLPDAIDRELTLLKLHLPYFESDHLLTHAYNIFAGGTCIEDIASLQDSEAFKNLVGACRVPDPTTAGDFLRRFDVHSLSTMDTVLDEKRSRVWKSLPRRMRRRATVDLDSTIKPVYGECKHGADFSYKGTWSYHPLLISVAETNECLRLINRSGNTASADGVEEALQPCLPRLKEAFDQVIVRGDSAFYRKDLIKLCEVEGADFALVMDAWPALVAAAEALPTKRFTPFEPHPRKPTRRRVRSRHMRERTRRRIAARRGYRTLATTAVWVAEMRYRPGGLNRDYRVIVKRQRVKETQGQRTLITRYVYRFIITSIETMTAADVLRLAYGRCNQENTIEQLKNGLAALSMPTGELLANAAFMLAALIAWSLRAWLSLLALPIESLRWEWKRFRHAFLYVAAKVTLTARAVVVKLASSHRFTPDMLAASRRLDAIASG